MERSLFPIGRYQKREIREIASKLGLASADRKDSQGICFVGKVDINEFLKLKINEKVGNIVDIDTGEVLGKHNGVWFFTHRSAPLMPRYNPETGTLDEVREKFAGWPDDKQGYIVWFLPNEFKHVVPPEMLAEFADL